MGLASQFGFDMGGSADVTFSGSNLLELMKSRSLVEKTLLNPLDLKGKTFSLVEMYLDFNKIRESWEDNDRLKNVQFLPNADRKKFTRVQDSVLGTVYENLVKAGLTVVQKDKKKSIMSVEVKSTNELFSKYFTEELVR